MIDLKDGLIHASCVSLDGKGILITGKSGSGKSSLALELIQLGATLVCDDQVRLENATAHAVAAIEGVIEVRGLGLLRCQNIKHTPLALIVDMDTSPSRMPDRKAVSPQQIELLSGCDVPNLALGIKLLLQNGRMT